MTEKTYRRRVDTVRGVLQDLLEYGGDTEEQYDQARQAEAFVDAADRLFPRPLAVSFLRSAERLARKVTA